MGVIILKDESLEELKKEGLVLIDFYATWCGPCKMLAPVLDNFAAKRSDVKVIKVDVDENQDIAIKTGVMSVPTLLLLKDNEEIARKSGYMPEEILNE